MASAHVSRWAIFLGPATYERNLTPIIFPIRQIAMHLMRSEATTNVNREGSSIAPTNSKTAPVSDWLRMRQAIACPLNSMRPAFKTLHPSLHVRVFEERPDALLPLFREAKGPAPFQAIESVDDFISIENGQQPI